MNRLVVVIALCAAAVSSLALACGGSDKPPLTPDSEHTETADAGASPSSTATTTTDAGK